MTKETPPRCCMFCGQSSACGCLSATYSQLASDSWTLRFASTRTGTRPAPENARIRSFQSGLNRIGLGEANEEGEELQARLYLRDLRDKHEKQLCIDVDRKYTTSPCGRLPVTCAFCASESAGITQVEFPSQSAPDCQFLKCVTENW